MPEPKSLAKANENRVRTGRPKGSRNKITLIKLMAEEAVRDRNLDKMLQVCQQIIDDALDGDFNSRKLVWQSVMSKSGTDPSTSSEAAPTIIVRTDAPVHVSSSPRADLEGEIIDVTPVKVNPNG
jgi:hypothetical protein